MVSLPFLSGGHLGGGGLPGGGRTGQGSRLGATGEALVERVETGVGAEGKMPSRRRQLGETGKPLRMLTVFWLRKAVTQLPERPPGRPRAAGPVGPAADSAGAFPASLGR